MHSRLDSNSARLPVPIGSTPALRAVVLGLPLIYFSVIGILNLWYGTGDAILPYLGLLALALVMFAPAAIWPGLGPGHVLVLPALWWLLQLAARQSRIAVFGLSEHVALRGLSSSELNVLYAELQLLAAAAHLAFLLGFSAVRRPLVPRIELPAARALVPKALLVLGFGVLTLLVYDRVAGGLDGMLLMRGMTRVLRDEIRGGGHFTVLLGVPTVLAYLLYELRERAWQSPLFWASFAFALTASFLVSGSRSGLLYPVVVLTLVHFLVTGKLPKTALLAAVLVGWIVIGVVAIFRTQHFGADSVDWGLFADYDLSDLFGASSDTVVTRATLRDGSLPVLYHVPEDSPLLFGSTYLRVLLAPLPQALLPFDKPLAAGRLNGQTFFSIDAGVPVGPVIEAYWNFHLPGVLLLFFLVGAASAYAVSTYLANRKLPAASVGYVLFLLYFNCQSDNLIQLVQTAAVLLALVVLFCGWPRLRGWQRAETQAWR